jgi:hypothetical protein
MEPLDMMVFLMNIVPTFQALDGDSLWRKNSLSQGDWISFRVGNVSERTPGPILAVENETRPDSRTSGLQELLIVPCLPCNMHLRRTGREA